MKRMILGAALLAGGFLAGTAVAADSALDQALAAFRAGEFKKVVEVAEATPAGAAERPKVLYLAGEAQLVLGAWKDAERSFLAVLEARPEAVPAYVGLARSLTRQEAYEDAELHLSAALELEPKDVGARRAIAELYARTERLPEARKMLEKLYKEEASAANARSLTEVMLLAGDAEDAERVARKLAKAQPKHPMGHFLLAVVQERLEKDADAILSYQQALKCDEKFLDAHKNLAILCHTLSDTYQIKERNELALAHYERYFALGGRDEELEKTYRTLKGFLEGRDAAGG